jgi:ubiquinone/menaquinone biosynthesis C-methylase UbiE
MPETTHSEYLEGRPTRKSIVKYFDGEFYTRYIAPFYDSMTTLSGWRRKMAKNALAGIKSGKMLDVGCGTGYVMNIARKMGFDVAGIDPSEGMLEKAKIQFNFTKELFQTTADTLPFPDNHFDFILASGSLAYVPKIAETAKEMARVLKPGGIIRVIDHTYPKEKNLFTGFIYLFTHASGDLIHDYPFQFKPYCTMKQHRTLGRGGFMQLFDFQK